MSGPVDPTVVFTLVDPESEPAVAAMTNYFNELNAVFRDGFDVAAALQSGLDAMKPPTGAFVVALGGGGQVLGCGGVQALDASTGEIKRMWIAPPARGIGLGSGLLVHLEQQIDQLGYTRIVLDTNDALTPAVGLYERAGYRLIPAYNDNPYANLWFEKDLAPPS